MASRIYFTEIICMSIGDDMSIIKSVIKDEYERNIRMQKAYSNEIELLPRGSVTNKIIKGHTYHYLMYRQDGKVINKYLSPSKFDIELLKEKIERRRQLEKIVRNLKKEQREMEKYLKGTEDDG